MIAAGFDAPGPAQSPKNPALLGQVVPAAVQDLAAEAGPAPRPRRAHPLALDLHRRLRSEHGFVRHALGMRSTEGWLDLPLGSEERAFWLPDTDPALDLLSPPEPADPYAR